MYDIFISYRTTYSQWVETLAINLQTQDYKVFLDRWELIPGQDFAAKLHEALSESRLAILVATPDTCDSGWVQQEYASMLKRKNNEPEFFFIPIVMGEFPDLPFLDTIQAVDFGDSSPDLYRRAFHKLICGIKQKPPGSDLEFTGSLKLPKALTACNREMVANERTFLSQVFERLEHGRPLMILAQADTNTQIYACALREKAIARYGAENVFHIFPPNSTRADSAAYFSRLARQCHFEGAVGESWQWAGILEERLESGVAFFLLVSGFENGADECRAELAGELRMLSECFFPRFHLVMMGSQRLASLKYAQGDLSLLNIADELPVPEPTARDLTEIFGSIYQDLALNEHQIREVLVFTGGQPRLLHHCLQQGATSAEDCRRLLKRSPLPVQLFTHFQDESDLPALTVLLESTDLAPYDTWPADTLLRRLYWCNLLTQREGRFAWRCDFIRQTGRELLCA
jgi:hypothetical protein